MIDANVVSSTSVKRAKCKFCTMSIEDFEESEIIDGKEYHKPCGKIMRAISV